MAYVAGDHLFRTVMTADSGLVKDEVVNDFVATHGSGAPSSTDLANAENCISDFFRAVQANTHHVGDYISNAIDRAATHRIDVYKIVTGSLGSPVASYAWLGPTTAPFNTGVPEEVCACLSYHADLTGIAEVGGVDSAIPSDEAAIDEGAPTTHSGRDKPKSRRRGRLYLGPLGANAIVTGGPPYLLDSTFLQTVRQAAQKMASDLTAVGWTWSVWSRRDQTVRPVVGGWTDDAPDIQRRRGRGASTRVSYTV